jgi:hypothetical protein
MTLRDAFLMGLGFGAAMALPMAFYVSEWRHGLGLRRLIAEAEERNREHLALYAGLLPRLEANSRALEMVARREANSRALDMAANLSARNNPTPETVEVECEVALCPEQQREAIRRRAEDAPEPLYRVGDRIWDQPLNSEATIHAIYEGDDPDHPFIPHPLCPKPWPRYYSVEADSMPGYRYGRFEPDIQRLRVEQPDAPQRDSTTPGP